MILWGECELNFSHSHNFVDIHVRRVWAVNIYKMIRMLGVQLTVSSQEAWVSTKWWECEKFSSSHSHHFVDNRVSCEESVSYDYLQNDKNVTSSAHSLLTRSMIIYSMMGMWGVELTASSPHHFVANQGPLWF